MQQLLLFKALSSVTPIHRIIIATYSTVSRRVAYYMSVTYLGFTEPEISQIWYLPLYAWLPLLAVPRVLLSRLSLGQKISKALY